MAHRGLAEDYGKWATQEEYRVQRAKVQTFFFFFFMTLEPRVE